MWRVADYALSAGCDAHAAFALLLQPICSMAGDSYFWRALLACSGCWVAGNLQLFAAAAKNAATNCPALKALLSDSIISKGTPGTVTC
jgi:hypothetical protein